MFYSAVKDYFFHSSERYKAWLLVLAILLTIVGLVYITYGFAAWQNMFWLSISDMNEGLYQASVRTFMYLTAELIGVSSLNTYLRGLLENSWITWLREDLSKKFNDNYLHFKRQREQDPGLAGLNPGQIIQEDIELFVKKAISICSNIITGALTAVVFVKNLWILGGSASFVVAGISLTIPGYLVWVSLALPLLSTILIHFIGKRLIDLNKNQQTVNAGLREDADHMHDKAETIAIDGGKKFFGRSFINKSKEWLKNAYDVLIVNTKLSAITSVVQNIAFIYPFLVTAPLYFAKKITLGELDDIAMSFMNIQYALNAFSASYADYAEYKARGERLEKFNHILKQSPSHPRESQINRFTHSPQVMIKNLTVKGNNSEIIFSNLSGAFPKQWTVIHGASGSGKSTLLRVIAGTWQKGEGEVGVPQEAFFYFPQEPIIPYGTLEEILAYPKSATAYSYKEYEEVLDLVCLSKLKSYLMTKDAGNPNKKENPHDVKKHRREWSNLSGGQRQLISFARLFLTKPKKMFLDEATSAMDPVLERKMYCLIRERIPGAMVLSIAHKETVDQFHEFGMVLAVDEAKVGSLSFFKRPLGVEVKEGDYSFNDHLRVCH